MTKFATDPPVSESQRKAMFAAASGHSTIGIPSSVGKEFSNADPGGKLPAKAKDMSKSKWGILKKLFLEWISEEEAEPEHGGDTSATDPNNGTPAAAGVAFITPKKKALFIKRSTTGDHAGTWCFPGGMREGDESSEDCARREAREEIGDCSFDGMAAWDCRALDGGPQFATYSVPVKDEFEPTLNSEATDHVWASLDNPPQPLHPGVAVTLAEKLKGGEDAPSLTAKITPVGKFAKPLVAGAKPDPVEANVQKAGKFVKPTDDRGAVRLSR